MPGRLDTIGVLAAACLLLGASAGENLLANPGFEAGREGWSWRDKSRHWGDFRVVDDPVHSGANAVHLHLAHGGWLPHRGTKVYGVLQELEPGRFPDRISGWYRVDHWEKEAEDTDLYLQVVVIVWDDPRTAELVPHIENIKNYQIRYYVAGQPDLAVPIGNAKIAILSKEQPVLGKWAHFEIPLRIDFEKAWEVVPEGYSRISVLFEARWDNLPKGTSVAADVYFDDLFVGYDTAD